MAIGKLMKNTQRHDATSTSTPPSNGPSAIASVVNEAHCPMARPRRASGKWALKSARLPGTTSAAPTP